MILYDLDIIPSFKVRSYLSKLRLSAQNLRIETGRFFEAIEYLEQKEFANTTKR